jgi:hypothetical protein
VGKLRRLSQSLNLTTESIRILTAPQPYFLFFAPLALIELLWMRVTMSWLPLFGATILIASRAPDVAGASAGTRMRKKEDRTAA